MKKILIFAFLFIFSGNIYPDIASIFTDTFLKENDLVDVQSLDHNIRVELKYAVNDNFLRKNVYGNLTKCYLRAFAAKKLAEAQRLLREKKPGYSLLVYDGLRPRSIQYMMWDIVKNTDMQQYVANPKSGSIHNYGAAVDLTIADEKGMPLNMGTPFDYFGIKAQPKYENIFLDPKKLGESKFDKETMKLIEDDLKKSGELKPAEYKNRLLLREVMIKAGFEPISNEWWHFNAMSNQEVKAKYKIIE